MIPNEIAGGQGPESTVSFDFQKRMLHDDRRRPSSRWKGGEHVAKGMGMRKEKKKPKKKKQPR